MSHTVRSTVVRFCVTAFVAVAALAVGATSGQASTVRPAYSACTISNGGNIYFPAGSPIPNDVAYCINGWEFINQNDGNFVIYNPSGYAVWAGNTDVGRVLQDRMQSDGNFVIYDGDTAVWSTRTSGSSAAYLCFQVDGNMVIYPWDGGHYTCTGHAVWASGT